MSPNFWGCRCCGGYCTHRVFTAGGELVWSKRHPGIVANALIQDSSNSFVFDIGIDDGGRVITTRHEDVSLREFIDWGTADGMQGDIEHLALGLSIGMRNQDASGGVYILYSSDVARRMNADLSTDWNWSASSNLPVVAGSSVSLSGTLTPSPPMLSQDESLTCIRFARSFSVSILDRSGVALVDSDGVHVNDFEEQWLFASFDPVVPSNARFDQDGNIVLVFGPVVYRESNPASPSGRLWVYQPDGTLVNAFTAAHAGPGSAYFYNGVYEGVFYCADPTDSHVYAYSLTDGSVLFSVDLSSYCTGTFPQITQCQVSPDGTVYSVCGFRNLVAMDSSLNVIWTFNENDGEISGGSNRPIMVTGGMRCSSGYVAFGGCLKKTRFGSSQLVIYP